jgi:glycosyltransferase involved in cell wall biosynthesis
LDIINSYKDGRIIVIKNIKNKGLTKSLNIGINKSIGEYIARMDSDDISIKTRLESQLNFMEENPDVCVLGGVGIRIGTNKYLSGIMPSNIEKTRIRMLFDNVTFPHSSAFIRKSFLCENRLFYDEKILKSQDYDLWTKCLEKGKIYSLPEVITLYRIQNDQISTKQKDTQKKYANIVKTRQLHNLCDELTIEEEEEFLNLNNIEISNSIQDSENMLNKLLMCNKKKQIYDDKLFERELKLIWFIKGVRRFKKIRKVDIIKSKFFYRTLLSSRLIYIIRSLVFQKLEIKKIIKSYNHIDTINY